MANRRRWRSLFMAVGFRSGDKGKGATIPIKHYLDAGVSLRL